MGLDYQMLQAALKHLPHRNDLRKGEGRFGSFFPFACWFPFGPIQSKDQRPTAGECQAALSKRNTNVSAVEQCRRDGETECLGHLHVDYQFELCDLAHREIIGLFAAAQHSVKIVTDFFVSRGVIRSVAHQSTASGKFSNWIDCRYLVSGC